ncbi:hypothetical protein D3C71_1738530 [compost metagenome]
MAHRREQLRGTAEQGLGAGAGGQLGAQAAELALARRLHLDQAVHEHPVAVRGRHPAGRGVRRAEQPQVFQVAKDVADGGRADIQAGMPGKRLRADRFAILDVTRDQRPQQMAGAWGEMGRGRMHGISL